MANARKRRPRRPVVVSDSARVGLRRLDWRVPVVLVVFAVAFLLLGTRAYTRSAATWDEPIHLTAGYAALTQQDFRIDPSHPPLLRMWAALPTLLMDDVAIDTKFVDAVPPEPWLPQAYRFAHRFLYVDHDADRLLYRARFMVLLLGVGLGVLLFFWAREWFGFWPAVLGLSLYTLEPNLVAHASLVTTDFGLTCFVFGAVYFLWRLHRTASWWNVGGLTVCCALALVTKFSGLLLAPIVVLLLAVAVRRAVITPRFAAAVAAVVAVGSVVVIWAAYGFRYLPSASDEWTFALDQSSMAEAAPRVAAVVHWIDSHHLLPNAFTQGVFYADASVGQLPAFLAGEIRTGGWWYYFPIAFLLKTPLALLLLLGAGLLAWVRRRDMAGANLLFVAVPVLTFFGVAMVGGVNIGLRHVLPVYPFVLLVASAGVFEFMRMRRSVGVTALTFVLVVGTAEFASVYPHTLTFFNQLAGGPGNGFHYLTDSNLAWGQSLKGLKEWMDRNGVGHVNLAYFGQADPAYYRIDCTYLPGAPSFAIDKTARPQLPGYVAISATTLSGVYAAPEWRIFYRPFLELEPVALIGNSIRVYWVEEWPSIVDALPADLNTDNAQRHLADALLFGLRWPARAARLYHNYLDQRPGDTDAWVNYGMALITDDRVSEGIDALRQAATDSGHARAQLTLARALLGSGDPRGASTYAQRAVALAPNDADAHYLHGRVSAALGDFVTAQRAFKRALDIDPSHQEARRDFARVQQELGIPTQILTRID